MMERFLWVFGRDGFLTGLDDDDGYGWMDGPKELELIQSVCITFWYIKPLYALAIRGKQK